MPMIYRDRLELARLSAVRGLVIVADHGVRSDAVSPLSARPGYAAAVSEKLVTSYGNAERKFPRATLPSVAASRVIVSALHRRTDGNVAECTRDIVDSTFRDFHCQNSGKKVSYGRSKADQRISRVAHRPGKTVSRADDILSVLIAMGSTSGVRTGMTVAELTRQRPKR